MKKMRMSLLSLMAGVLVLGAAIVSDASAGIRVDATIHTPNVRVRVGNMPSRHHRSHATEYFPVRMHDAVTKQDRKIARRLSKYTGVPSAELIQLKRRGYRWFEIGQWLQLPRPVVRASMTHKSWKRFLRDDRRVTRCIIEPYRMREITYFDGRYRR